MKMTVPTTAVWLALVAAPVPGQTPAASPAEDSLFEHRRVALALLAAEEGTVAEALDDALEWLARNQGLDGSWAGPEGEGGRVGQTSLALLALLGAGNTQKSGPHSRAVGQGIDWLLSQRDSETGLLGAKDHHAFLYGHALGTLVLAELARETGEAAHLSPLIGAVEYISRARNPYSAWRYDVPPIGDNDTSVTCWMVQALASARLAGVGMDDAALQGAINWVEEVTDPETGRVGYDSMGSYSARLPETERFPRDAGEAMTAAGLLIQIEVARVKGRAPTFGGPLLAKQMGLLRNALPAWDPEGLRNDMYYWQLGSLVSFHLGGRSWELWRDAFWPAAVESQRRFGEERGSWDPGGPWGGTGGRVYSTAMMALGLEASVRFPRALELLGEDTLLAETGEQEAEPGFYRGDGRDLEPGAEIQDALQAGLEWLAAHQSPDGYWDADDFMHNRPGARSEADGPGNPQHDVGVTAAALLAFLGEGSTPLAGPRPDVVARGIKWLFEQQDPDTGLIGSQASHEFLYNHALATLTLCECYRLAEFPLFKKHAQAAVDYIHRARNPYGAWRYDVPPIGDNDTSVTGWMVLALASAKDAGLQVDDQALHGARSWIDEVTDPTTGRVGYDSMGSFSSRTVANEHYSRERGEAMTSVGLLCRFVIADALGEEPPEAALLYKHAELLLRTLPEWDPDGFGCDMYYWHFGTYAMYQMGGRHWKAWRAAMEPAVVGSQRLDGDFRGSWDPIGPWGYSGGRVYATALQTLCLEAYYRYARVLGDG